MRRRRILILVTFVIVELGVALVLLDGDYAWFARAAIACLPPLALVLAFALIALVEERIRTKRSIMALGSRLAQTETIRIKKGHTVIDIPSEPSPQLQKLPSRPKVLKLVGLTSLGLAVVTTWLGFLISHPNPSLQDFISDLYPNVVTSLASLGFAILVLDSLYTHQRKQDLREQAIRDFGSLDNGIAIRATEILRTEEWHRDGSLSRKHFLSADLQGTFLRDYDLTGCILGGANLRSADLTSAHLEGAVLAAADLTDATLDGSYLGGSDLREVEVSITQLRTTHSLRQALMQDGKRYDGRYALAGDISAAKRKGIDVDNGDDMARFYRVDSTKYNE